MITASPIHVNKHLIITLFIGRAMPVLLGFRSTKLTRLKFAEGLEYNANLS